MQAQAAAALAAVTQEKDGVWAELTELVEERHELGQSCRSLQARCSTAAVPQSACRHGLVTDLCKQELLMAAEAQLASHQDRLAALNQEVSSANAQEAGARAAEQACQQQLSEKQAQLAAAKAEALERYNRYAAVAPPVRLCTWDAVTGRFLQVCAEDKPGDEQEAGGLEAGEGRG